MNRIRLTSWFHGRSLSKLRLLLLSFISYTKYMSQIQSLKKNMKYNEKLSDIYITLINMCRVHELTVQYYFHWTTCLINVSVHLCNGVTRLSLYHSDFITNVFRYIASSTINVVNAKVATNYIGYAGVITLTTVQHIATYCRVHTTKQDTVSNNQIYNQIYNQWLTIKALI